MAALAEFSETGIGNSSPSAETFLQSLSSHATFLNSPPQTEDEARIRRLEKRRSMPASARATEEVRNAAPGILDRRKSTRPKDLRIESGSATRLGREGKGVGPKIPIIPSPLVESPLPLSNMQNESRAADGDITPGETSASDAFEDAPETTTNGVDKPAIGGTENQRDRSNSFEAETGGGEVISVGEHDRPSLPSRSRSRSTVERVPSASQEGEGRASGDMRRNGATQPSQNTVESAPSLPPPEQEIDRAVSPSKMDQSPPQKAVIESVPVLDINSSEGYPEEPTILLSPDIGPVDRSRSVSPTAPYGRARSPPKFVRGLSDGSMAIGGRTPPASSSPQPPGIARSASTRIAGFFRMGSIRKPGRSPPAPATERRNTAASIASLTSPGGDSLATIEDSPEDTSGVKRPSLQAQFQTLRKQEEHDAPKLSGGANDGAQERSEIGRSASDAGIGSPTGSIMLSPELKGRSTSTSGPLRSPPLDPTLPPGTASGLAAGPAEEPRPVDWDLWQAVVNEGPSAVARSSGEELDRAIASGIPAAIRGVVWQVLADSKNVELENLYQTLKARGVEDAEQQHAPRPPPMSREPSQNNFTGTAEKGEKDSEVASSRSSVNSEKSTPATSTIASQTSPLPSVQGDEADGRAALLAEKAKRESAALTKLERAIKRDLGSRTSYSKYAQAAGLQDGLFGLCKAYALFDEGVGYAQGINFIAMPLLFNMAEEEAFTLLVRLMSKYDVRTLFTGNMSGLHLRLYQFERLLEDRDPALYCHLRRRNVTPQLYTTQWFLTLFAYRFPLQLVLRVYDLIFSQGLTAILKFGLVLMEHNRDALLGMKDMGHLTNFLKERLFDVYIDKSPSPSSLLDSGFFGSVSGGADKELYRADEMVRDACEVEISEATLAAYTAEWQESQRLTNEKDTELETLRVANTNLTSRLKSLEDRTQQQDTEHVTLATDVVRIKIENDRLFDENEGLKIKVEELQKVVDTQPVEVEERLKGEMDRILERNSIVQNENRVLKEEQEEMEGQMVDIKMKHAQAQQDFEALSQKWANIQAMLSDK